MKLKLNILFTIKIIFNNIVLMCEYILVFLIFIYLGKKRDRVCGTEMY